MQATPALQGQAAVNKTGRGDAGRAAQLTRASSSSAPATARTPGRQPSDAHELDAPPRNAPPRPSARGPSKKQQQLRAVQAAILAGDVPRLVSCALSGGSGAACKAAADHLCSLDWPAQPALAAHIIALYTQVDCCIQMLLDVCAS